MYYYITLYILKHFSHVNRCTYWRPLNSQGVVNYVMDQGILGNMQLSADIGVPISIRFFVARYAIRGAKAHGQTSSGLESN